MLNVYPGKALLLHPHSMSFANYKISQDTFKVSYRSGPPLMQICALYNGTVTCLSCKTRFFPFIRHLKIYSNLVSGILFAIISDRFIDKCITICYYGSKPSF